MLDDYGSPPKGEEEDEYLGAEEEDEQISAEDCWAVIASYFADKTLVSQQIE